MIIWSSINCPTAICSPTVSYFSQEKPLVKSAGPGSLSHIFTFAIYFICLLFSDLLNQKYKNISLHFFYLVFDLSIFTTLSRPFANFWRHYPKGIDNPFNTSGCEYLLFVCRCCLCSVARFSYWFDNLGFITEEILTAVVLHHPFLFGEIPT